MIKTESRSSDPTHTGSPFHASSSKWQAAMLFKAYVFQATGGEHRKTGRPVVGGAGGVSTTLVARAGSASPGISRFNRLLCRQTSNPNFIIVGCV